MRKVRDDDMVCAHTDFRFKSVNEGICPYCHQRMNIITRRVWGGSIRRYFHALAEMVCSNRLCPFPNADSWKTAESMVIRTIDNCKDMGCKDCFLWVDEHMSPYEKDMYCSMRKCVTQKESKS